MECLDGRQLGQQLKNEALEPRTSLPRILIAAAQTDGPGEEQLPPQAIITPITPGVTWDFSGRKTESVQKNDYEISSKIHGEKRPGTKILHKHPKMCGNGSGGIPGEKDC